MRKRVCDRLTFLGIKIDDAANMIKGKWTSLPLKGSEFAIPTNEELVIARIREGDSGEEPDGPVSKSFFSIRHAVGEADRNEACP